MDQRVLDPMKFKDMYWPHVTFYNKQREAIYSARDNDETFLPAGNELGKDFVAGFTLLWFFMTRHPCRVVTTSAKEDHLRVLWGEINRFIQTARYPLDSKQGGPLIVNHQDIRKVVNKQKCAISYVIGLVASQDKLAAMQGHHANPMDIRLANDGIPRTLFVVDEASSVPSSYWQMASTWMKRALVIGNCWPCGGPTGDFFKAAVKGRPGTPDRGGNILAPDGEHYIRKVIKITADDSPNVRLAKAQIAAGKQPTGEVIIPGVKSWNTYQKDILTMSKAQLQVSHSAEFWEGADQLMFPSEWLEASALRAVQLNQSGVQRKAKAIGIDPGEGDANTAMAAVDEHGLIELISKKTPDTSVITGDALAFMLRHAVKPDKVVFDRGGGGKQHADRLRAQGYPVQTVAFGESVMLDYKRGMTRVEERRENREEKYAYRHRRDELYGTLRQLLDPSANATVFAIPAEYTLLREELAPIPLQYDGEGRLDLPPKTKKDPDSTIVTLIELIGHSPDEADALTLAIYGMTHKPLRAVAGAV